MANNLHVLRLYVPPITQALVMTGVAKHGTWPCDYFAKPYIVIANVYNCFSDG